MCPLSLERGMCFGDECFGAGAAEKSLHRPFRVDPKYDLYRPFADPRHTVALEVPNSAREFCPPSIPFGDQFLFPDEVNHFASKVRLAPDFRGAGAEDVEQSPAQQLRLAARRHVVGESIVDSD